MDQGASFRRACRYDMVETARVISVSPDSVGIPHVKFSLRITGPRGVSEDQRTLSLESFQSLYRERIAKSG
jgi:hypothetical protein